MEVLFLVFHGNKKIPTFTTTSKKWDSSFYCFNSYGFFSKFQLLNSYALIYLYEPTLVTKLLLLPICFQHMCTMKTPNFGSKLNYIRFVLSWFIDQTNVISVRERKKLDCLKSQSQIRFQLIQIYLIFYFSISRSSICSMNNVCAGKKSEV